ncbi:MULTISPECIES: hypothetical protein [unclassified Nocardia]|nr:MULTISPECIES: hypothetical protein [unclassified Nocardia]
MTCLFFVGGIAALSRSPIIVALAAVSIVIGLAVTRSILPHDR